MDGNRRIKGKYDHLKVEVRKKEKNRANGSGNNKIYGLFLISILVFAGLLASGVLNTGPGHDLEYNQESVEIWEEDATRGLDMVLYSSPDCGCCHIYNDYLQTFDFTTSLEYPTNLADIKDYQGIPKTHRSCHTVQFSNYFIEGHVPIEAINKLILEQPEIDGVTLPGMPAGSPGMDGQQIQDFEISSIKDGQIVDVFMVISA